MKVLIRLTEENERYIMRPYLIWFDRGWFARTICCCGGLSLVVVANCLLDIQFSWAQVEASQNETVKAETIEVDSQNSPFRFVDHPGQYLDIELRNQKKVRLVYQRRDGSNEASHYLTYKPFHQIFDPAQGTTLLTSGVHPLEENPQFPHHRGLFFGFNKIQYGDLKADTWHCTNNVYTQVESISERSTHDDHCRLTTVIGWYGPDGSKFAEENRTVILYDHADGILLDWFTELTTDQEWVTLDGDPQHAGFHFRANQEVAKSTVKQTWYVRPDGVGLPGETRNWNPQNRDSKTINLPWNAISFMVAGRRFSVLRISHSENPGETRGSERDYGRFGDYFEYQLTPSNPLRLKYRLFVTEGELSVDHAVALAAEFRQTEGGD